MVHSFFEHNHEVSTERYNKYPQNRRLNEEEISEAREQYGRMHVGPSLISEQLSKKTGKIITARQVLNMRLSTRSLDYDVKELNEFLQKTIDDGGVVEHLNQADENGDNITKALFLSTIKMKQEALWDKRMYEYNIRHTSRCTNITFDIHPDVRVYMLLLFCSV